MENESNANGDAKRKPPNRSDKMCGFCGKVFKNNFSRHFTQMHPGKDPLIAISMLGGSLEFMPYKAKSMVDMSENSSISGMSDFDDSILGKRPRQPQSETQPLSSSKRQKVIAEAGQHGAE